MSVRVITSVFESVFSTQREAPIQLLEDKTVFAEPVEGDEVPALNDEEVIPEELIDNDNEKSFERPMETKTYIHMKTYPIVASWVKIFHWFPQPHFARDTMMMIAYSKYLREYTMSVDNRINKGLDQLDKRAPFVKTLRMRDIRNIILDNPIRSIVNNSQQVMLESTDLTKKHLVQPSRRALYYIRDLRDGYVDFESQPILRSQLNSVFKGVNLRLIKRTNTYLPRDEQKNELPINYVTFDPKSNERTIRIINCELLSTSRRHIGAVYQASKENRGEGHIVVVIATLDAMRVLVNQGFELLTDHSFVRFLESEPQENEQVPIAKEEEEQIKELDNVV